jgi:Uncharacterized protein conserved in bacteria (DUF2188)
VLHRRRFCSHLAIAGHPHVSTTRPNSGDNVSKSDVHTVPYGEGWVDKVEGKSSVSNAAATKAEAQKCGRDMAMKSRVEHHIHKKDGTVGQRSSYGNDPRRSKG